jgi:hypothetical protein
LLRFLAGFLGLGRPTAFAFLPLRLQLLEVVRTSLGDLPPAPPSKTDGGGIFLLWQNLAIQLSNVLCMSEHHFPNPHREPNDSASSVLTISLTSFKSSSALPAEKLRFAARFC